ncbi:MAG: tRNA (guanosine(37)-N1)-methyltransferase TrmD [Dehalococcoidia bacterium]|nr:tRNA (guanosine(37)-N1)-methyltransferase TrmD [Dehalococcoidia bacterium]
MQIDIITIFPGMFRGPFDESIIRRAIARGSVRITVHDLRDWATDRHRTVDDYPFGGGPGMVMKPEPIFAAVESILAGERGRIILLSPAGRRFTQAVAEELARERRLLLICGHYEGVDDRVREHLATDEISIGDFVLTGGELAAMVIVDAVVRLLPGVIAGESLAAESHSSGLLEYPQYTRPAEFRGWRVPEVLLSGNHAAIAAWRRQQAILRTARQRPDLLAQADLSPTERAWLAEQLAGGDQPAPTREETP